MPILFLLIATLGVAAERPGLDRIEHFVFVLLPGHSFDSLFGRYASVEGDGAGLTERDIPHLWTYARQYVIQDQFFSTPGPDSFPARLHVGPTAVAPMLAPLTQAGVTWAVVSRTEFLDRTERRDLPNATFVVLAPGEDSRSALTQMINAHMRGALWYRSAMLLAWEDGGGEPDHVPVPEGLGTRVPSIVISTYARSTFHDHGRYSFDSWLRLLETRFGVELVPSGRPVVADLYDPFDFSQESRAPYPLDPFGAIPFPPVPQLQRFPLSWLGSVNVAYGTFIASPGMMVDGYVRDFGAEAANADQFPLPFELSGVSVTIRDSLGVLHQAPIHYAGPFQVNYKVPDEVATGVARVVVTGPTKQVWGNLIVERISPGLLSSTKMGDGPADGVFALDRAGQRTVSSTYDCSKETEYDCPSVPIPLGESERSILTLYGSGIRNRASLGAVRATISGLHIPVLYAGPSERYPWIDQVDLELPPELQRAGRVLVFVTVEEKAANPVQIVLQ
ncbi:MAG: alkaline phosphatase family protein [Acidobacteriota bacterium]